MTRLSIIVLASLLVMSGCSTMSKKDCLSADWYALGVQDGQAGQPVSRMNQYQESCQKHDVSVNQGQYRSGYDVGIRRYCQPENGYQIGLNGRSLPNVCPADLQDAFATAHERGYTEFKIKRDINTATAKISQLNKSLPGLNESIVNAKAALLAATDAETKNSAQTSLNELLAQRDQVFANQSSASAELACASGDWYQAGVADGEAGLSAGSYRRHVRLCEPYHPAANQQRYIQGQSDGLQQYCTVETGYKLGQNGYPLSSLCQGNANRALQSGYQRGLDEHEEQVTIAGLKLKQTTLEKEIPALEREQQRLEAELKKDGLSSEQTLTLTRQLNRVKFDLSDQKIRLGATTDELNCYVAEWEVLGFEAGEQGLAYDNRSVTCADYGIQVNTESFRVGYDQGVVRYCTPGNGKRMGDLGQVYENVCPARLEPVFLETYIPAFRAYQRIQLRKELTIDIDQTNKLLTNVQTEIDVLSQDLELDTLSREERLALVDEISELHKRERTLSTDFDLLNAHFQCLTDDWFALGQTHGSEGLSSQLRLMNCERFSEAPDVTRYRNGLSRGLTTWCTAKRGFDMALAEEAATPACSKTTHREYFRGYADGEAERARQLKVNVLKLEKLDLIEELPVLRLRIEEIDAALTSTTLSNTSRQRLEREKRSISADILTKENRLQTIDSEIAALGG